MKKLILISLLIPFVVASCGGNKEKKEDKEQSYKVALQDSINACQAKIDSCSARIEELSATLDSNLSEFAYVENAREVEGYYILKNWQSRYPLQSTGIIARMNKGEQLELCAVLKGGTFDRIEVSNGESSVSSAVVPHDQALNYRRDGITTVMFSGNECDEVGNFIAANELNNLKLVFLEAGKVKSSWTIPADYKKMLSTTAVTAASAKELHSLELQSTMLHKKMDIIRKHLE